LGEIFRRRGNLPARSKRQAVDRLIGTTSATSGQRKSFSDMTTSLQIDAASLVCVV
jgi:hypothetical protein